MAIVMFLLALAVLGPLLGADSRDGRDWQPGFWEPGRLRQKRPRDCRVTETYCGLCGEPGRHPEHEQALVLEPPRYCAHCRRRMVVQVHPTGWSARCVEHGTVTG